MKQFNNLEECIAEIKRLRVQVDALIQIADENKTSAETTLAWRELQLAKSWLGKLLGDVAKTPSPYIQKSTDSIPPTAEVAELAPYKFDGVLDMCISQRNIIETTIQEFESFYWILDTYINEYNNQFQFNGATADEIRGLQKKIIRQYSNYRNLVSDHLHQARFWYGFEISNLRTNETQRYNPVKH